MDELTLAQSASLAATIKAPSAYAPNESPSLNKSRRNYILETMLEEGFIAEDAYNEAKDEEIWVLAQVENKQIYSWYVDEVLHECEDLLDLSADEVNGGGFQI